MSLKFCDTFCNFYLMLGAVQSLADEFLSESNTLVKDVLLRGQIRVVEAKMELLSLGSGKKLTFQERCPS